MEWKSCKNILVIRPDNMGDLLMSAPAIRALKESFGCHITLLTSSMAADASTLLPWVDELMCYNLPWIKTNGALPAEQLGMVIEKIRKKDFDGCILFNVSSQNPAPSIMIAFMAGIPLRAAYCRENLYGLLTHWLPDPEPYYEINHQVTRDLQLAAFIGAETDTQKMSICDLNDITFAEKLKGLHLKKNAFCIFHTGVSELKRQYPQTEWVRIATKIYHKYGLPIILTGNQGEQDTIEGLAKEIGEGAISVAGLLTLKELAALISQARIMTTVNTGPMHLAAATGTPVLALYARTNPQHIPWMVPCRIIEFDVSAELRSHNQVLRFQSEKAYPRAITFPYAEKVVVAFNDLFEETATS